MNKKIAFILAVLVATTASLVGCGSTTKDDLGDSASVADTTFKVSSVDDENEGIESIDDSEKKQINETTKKESDTINNKDSKTENKTTQDTKSNEIVDNNKNNSNSNSNNNSTKKEEKVNTGEAIIFRAQAGYTLTIPASWEGKYIIKEDPMSLVVSYKCSKDETFKKADLFYIERFTSENQEYNRDTVGNIRYFKVRDLDYIVGGPTGLTLDPSSEDFSEFEAINAQRAEVVNSIKVVI